MNKMLMFFTVLLTIFAINVCAQTAEQKGLEIVREIDRRDTGWVDMQAEMIMLLRNAHGEESTRNIRLKSLEVSGDGDKSLSIFNRPRDVKGTAFLTFSHAVGPDDQWLYLPALKKVKRISSKNKSGPFMGSEFSYEDLSSFEVDKFTYKFLREEKLNGIDCYVIESDPVDKFSGYTRLVNWVNKAEYRPEKIDYYDRKNAKLKTLTFKDYKKYLNQYWRASKFLMINHQNNKSTNLTWSHYRFKTGLTDQDFNKNTLKRAK